MPWRQLSAGDDRELLQQQLDEDIDAWNTELSPELLAAIDRIRWESRDPAQ